MGNESEKLGASGARNPGVRDEVERLVDRGELRQALEKADVPSRVIDSVVRAFWNAKFARGKYVNDGTIRQALERSFWSAASIDELLYSSSIREYVAKSMEDAIAKKIEKSVVEIENAAKTLVEKANCVHEPVSVHDSPLVCVKCGVEYVTSVVTTSLDLKPKTYDEKTRRAIFDALDNARTALDYIRAFVKLENANDYARVAKAYGLVAEAMAIVEGHFDWHSGG